MTDHEFVYLTVHMWLLFIFHVVMTTLEDIPLKVYISKPQYHPALSPLLWVWRMEAVPLVQDGTPIVFNVDILLPVLIECDRILVTFPLKPSTVCNARICIVS